MTINPLFSIITVTLNNLDGLKKTHQSLPLQTISNYEWIVIDGLSRDGTAAYLKETNAFIVSEEDSGIYDAMNKGIKYAKGDYLLFLNAGDSLVRKDIFSDIENIIEKETPDFIYGDSLEHLKNKIVTKKSRPHDIIKSGMFTHHQSMFYKKETLGNLRYSLDYTIASDYDFTLNFLKKSKVISYIEQPICLFESGGISQQHVLTGRKEQFKIRKKHEISKAKNMLIFFNQSLAYALRKAMPPIYWLLKR